MHLRRRRKSENLESYFFKKIISEILQKFSHGKTFFNKNECNHLPLYIPCLFFYFISNQRNNSFSTMLYKNFLKLSFSHRKTALCFNSDGTLLPFQTLHKPQVGKFPNDNSFSVNPRAYPPDARRVYRKRRARARAL